MPRNLKRGRGAQFPVYTFSLKISVKTKKKRSSRLPTSNLPPKKKVNASSDVLFPLFHRLHIYTSLYFSGEGGRDPSGPPPPGYAPGLTLLPGAYLEGHCAMPFLLTLLFSKKKNKRYYGTEMRYARLFRCFLCPFKISRHATDFYPVSLLL